MSRVDQPVRRVFRPRIIAASSAGAAIELDEIADDRHHAQLVGLVEISPAAPCKPASTTRRLRTPSCSTAGSYCSRRAAAPGVDGDAEQAVACSGIAAMNRAYCAPGPTGRRGHSISRVCSLASSNAWTMRQFISSLQIYAAPFAAFRLAVDQNSSFRMATTVRVEGSPPRANEVHHRTNKTSASVLKRTFPPSTTLG